MINKDFDFLGRWGDSVFLFTFLKLILNEGVQRNRAPLRGKKKELFQFSILRNVDRNLFF